MNQFSLNLVKSGGIILLISASLFSSVNIIAANCYGYANGWEQTENATIASPTAETFIDTGSYMSLFQAIRGTDNRLYFRLNNSENKDSSSWTSWENMGTITALSQPELKTFNYNTVPTLSISVLGTDKGLYTRNYTPASGFTNWVRGGNITIKAKPTVSFFGGKLIQSVAGGDNRFYNRTSVDGLNWTPWILDSTITLSERVEQTIFKSKLYQFARGTDNGLYTRYSSNGESWSEWVRDTYGITILNEPSTTFYDYSGTLKLQQMVRGTDNGYYSRTSDDGITWASWFRLNGNITFSDRPQFTNIETGCGNNFSIFAYGKGTNNRFYQTSEFADFDYENKIIFGAGWYSGDTITINNSPTEAHIQAYGRYARIESVRGTNNRIYTRIYQKLIY